MKANEFVKRFGWEQSIEAVKNMPKDWDYCCLHIPDFEFQKRVSCIADCVDMDDLKRLVESYELVKNHNGISPCKFWVSMMDGCDAYQNKVDLFKQAIADVESCQ